MIKKKISKKEAREKYGIIIKRFHNYEYFLLENGDVVDSDGDVRYTPLKEKEFIIVGDNNYWYAQGHTKSDLKQAKQSLKMLAKLLKKKGSVWANDEQMPEPSMLYLYVGVEVDRLKI